MLEILEQMKPHTYRISYSIKNIRTSKINISSHRHRKRKEILKEVQTSVFKLFYGIVNQIK